MSEGWRSLGHCGLLLGTPGCNSGGNGWSRLQLGGWSGQLGDFNNPFRVRQKIVFFMLSDTKHAILELFYILYKWGLHWRILLVNLHSIGDPDSVNPILIQSPWVVNWWPSLGHGSSFHRDLGNGQPLENEAQQYYTVPSPKWPHQKT